MENETHIVLGLYSNSRGLGYACIQVPNKVLDSGVLNVTPLSNEKIAVRVLRFIEFYRPNVLVIRDGEKSVPRIQELSDAITKIASAHNIPVHQYSREQVKDVFEIFGAKTKFERAHKIIETLPELASRAPKIRKAYMDEDYNMGVFDAVALIFVHEYLIA